MFLPCTSIFNRSKRALLTGLGLLASLSSFAADTTTKPNVIVIIADDIGLGSLGCYGADPKFVSTPHLDRLAAEGRKFTAGYSAASVCSPSRYAMMTGRYCWRTGNLSGVYNVADPLKIEVTRPTLASVLKSAGYNTAAVGKWHLGFGSGNRADFTKPLTPGPMDLGFNYDFLLPQNHGDITGVYVENDRVAGLRSANHVPAGKSTYGPDFLGIDAPQRVDKNVMSDLTDKIVQWLSQQKADTPFFLYYAPVALHNPITPSDKNKGKSGCGPYGDFMMDMDDSIGRILDELARTGLDHNTLILFTSDNGGEMGNGKSDTQFTARQAGFKINGDWRGGKHGVYEGGLRVPYIVRWPARVPAGTVSDEIVNGVDTLATLASICGATIPDHANNAEDSVDVSSAWLGTQETPARHALILNSEDGVFIVRSGPWKWIEGIPDPKKDFSKSVRRFEHQPQLYNLKDDPSETKNLVAENPELVQGFSTLLTKVRKPGPSRAAVAPGQN